MSLIISDYEVFLDDNEEAVGPGERLEVTARVGVAPLYVLVSSQWLLDQKGTRTVVPDYQTGEWTIVLPGPDECLPANPLWIITRANGIAFAGQVPADVPGPVNVHDLVTNYGWTVYSGSFVIDALEPANTVLAGPSTGSPALPGFRGLVPADIPDLDASKITSGTFPDSSLPIASAGTLGGIKVGSGLSIDGGGVLSASGGGVGTVTSVAMTVPSELSIAGSPITGAGTFALTWANETGNSVFASPSGGGSGTPGFRGLVAADIPNLDASQITTGTLSSARLPTADASNLGAIKVGTTLSIASGVLDYTLPIASATVLGGIKVGTGLAIDGSGVLTASGGGSYTLPTATATVLGGIKIGTSLVINSGVVDTKASVGGVYGAYTSRLASDQSVTANTYANPFGASLNITGNGTYLVVAHVTMTNATNAAHCTMKIVDDSLGTVIGSAEGAIGAAGESVTLFCVGSKIYSGGSTFVVHVECTMDASGGTVKANTVFNSVSNATQYKVFRIV